jgi:hypothetical protein
MGEHDPEFHLSALKIALKGEAAIRRAGWTIPFLLFCRAIAMLTLPWLPYLLIRWWSG